MEKKFDFSICIRCLDKRDRVHAYLCQNSIGERFYGNAPWIIQIVKVEKKERTCLCGIPLNLSKKSICKRMREFRNAVSYSFFEDDKGSKKTFMENMSGISGIISEKCMSDILFDDRVLADGSRFKDMCPYYSEHLLTFYGGGDIEEEKEEHDFTRTEQEDTQCAGRVPADEKRQGTPVEEAGRA